MRTIMGRFCQFYQFYLFILHKTETMVFENRTNNIKIRKKNPLISVKKVLIFIF